MTETAIGLLGSLTMIWSGLLVGWVFARDRRSYRLAIEELALSLSPLIDLKPPEAPRPANRLAAVKAKQAAKPKQATGFKPRQRSKVLARG